jgi:ApeA N-terminal domain 1
VESKPRHKSDTHKLKKLTGAQQAFLVYQRKQPKAQVAWHGKTYGVLFASSITQTGSSVEGTSIVTSDSVFIASKGGATLAELLSVSFQVEQFIALLCMGPFQAERVSIQLDAIRQVERFWKLGMSADRTALKLMPHQTLVALGRYPDLTQKALHKWFSANSATQLARWLIFDALFTEVSSTSKFLSVAQAWEVPDREESKVAPYNKKAFRSVCKNISKIVDDQLGKDAAERLVNLIRSSNRESFGDLVTNTAKKVPQLALDALCGDMTKFVSAVVDARNVLTHLQGKKKLSLEAASHLSLFLTYKLIALYCIHAATSIGLPADNLPMMLANNSMARTACRPLPDRLI